MYGPLCPIYGLGLLVMLLVCSDNGKSLWGFIIRCGLAATAMEYITSYWMEYVFHKRWWDYSDMFMNVNGRICLGAFILFGVLGAFFIRIMHPFIASLINRIPDRILRILDRTVIILFLYDILLSLRTNII